jgi:hypothetical protein
MFCVCFDATQPNTHPATTAHIKVFTFMPRLNSQRQPDCKLLLGRLLGGIEL